MDTFQLASELRALESDLLERKELEGMLAISESAYLERYLPTPEKKPIQTITPPSKEPLKKQKKKIIITAALSLILLIFVVFSYAKAIGYQKLWEDPGEEYEAWLDNCAYAQSEEELAENWKTVEKAWKKHGVKINWEFIEEEIFGKYLISNTDSFDSVMNDVLYDKWDSYNTRASLMVLPTLIVIVVLVFFIKAVKGLQATYDNQLERNQKLQKQNEANRKYNDTVYPTLVAVREKKLPDMRAKYALGIDSVRAKLEKVKQNIALRAPILPEYYHNNAGEIALILERGRADSLKEAINIFEDDKRAAAEAARRAAEERYRAEQEERHRRQMEEEARRAAAAAEKAANAAASAASNASAPKVAQPANEPYKMIIFYHFNGHPDYVGVNVISNVNNVLPAKKLMMVTYGKTEADIGFTSSERKGAPYFDGRSAH